MFIKSINYITEFFLWVLIYGITLANAPAEVASYLIIFLFFVKKIALRDIKFIKSPVTILLFAFFIFALFSFLHSNYPKDSLKGFSRVPKYIFLYLALVDFFAGDRKRLSRFFWAVIVISAVTFINGIFQSIFGFDFFRHNALLDGDSLRRVSSSFVHPNDFGAFVASVLPLTFVLLSPGMILRKRIILMVTCLLGFYCLLATSSRGAWIGFGAGVIVYLFIYRKKAALFLLAAFLMFIFIPHYGLQQIKSMPKLKEGSNAERMLLLKGTFNMIKEHPVVGFGINTFMKNFEKYSPENCPKGFYAHNSYLQMWAETGIVGLFIFLSVPLIILFKALRNIKKKILQGSIGLVFLGAMAGYMAFMVDSIVDNNFFSLVLMTLFWVLGAYLSVLDKEVSV